MIVDVVFCSDQEVPIPTTRSGLATFSACGSGSRTVGRPVFIADHTPQRREDKQRTRTTLFSDHRSGRWFPCLSESSGPTSHLITADATLPWHPSAAVAAHLLLQNITSPPAATYSDTTCPRRRRRTPFCPPLGVGPHVASAHWASSPCGLQP